MFAIKLIILNTLFIAAFLLQLPEHPVSFAIVTLLLIILLLIQTHRFNTAQNQLLRSVEDGLRSLQDGDFSISLPETGNQRDKPVIELFNMVTNKLRIEKQSLYQRELLLDKVINASDVLTVLVNHRQAIVFCLLYTSDAADD